MSSQGRSEICKSGCWVGVGTWNPENYDRHIWLEITEDGNSTDHIGFLGLQRYCVPPLPS